MTGPENPRSPAEPSVEPNDGPNIGLLMFVAYRAMEGRVLDALNASGFDDLTAAQARVFQRIGEHGSRLTDLAEQARVTKQSAGFLVDQLERAGYVERRPDPRDARARLVCISARGVRAVEVAAAVVAEVEAEWTRHLGERDMRLLRETLVRLREITDPYDGPDSQPHDRPDSHPPPRRRMTGSA